MPSTGTIQKTDSIFVEIKESEMKSLCIEAASKELERSPSSQGKLWNFAYMESDKYGGFRLYFIQRDPGV